MSASSLEHERRFYIEHGFQDFIGKPYPFQDVYRALVEHAGVRLRPAAPAAGRRRATRPRRRRAGGLRAGACASSCARWPRRAASGQLAAVGRLMEAIAPEAIGGARWRAFDDAAQAYDFQLLEERVSALLAQLDAARAPLRLTARPQRRRARRARIARICVQMPPTRRSHTCDYTRDSAGCSPGASRTSGGVRW